MGFLGHHPLIEYLDKGGSKFNPEKSFEFSNNLSIQRKMKNGLENRIRLFGCLKKAVFVIYNLNVR